jgi:hypothetical protein
MNQVVVIQVVQTIIDVRQGSANAQTLFAVQELTQIAIEIQQQQSKQRKTKHYQGECASSTWSSITSTDLSSQLELNKP